MSPYKSFLSAAKAYLNSHGLLRFLLSAHIAVFALGGSTCSAISCLTRERAACPSMTHSSRWALYSCGRLLPA